jgi:apolipoprotein N-acyltransferase
MFHVKHPRFYGYRRAGLAVISGLALAAAFPKLDLNLLAWLAFVPLLYAIEGERPGRVFRYGWLQGFACYIGSLYWIEITLHDFAKLPVVIAVLPLMLLAAVLALYSGAAFCASRFVSTRLRISEVVVLPIVWTAVEWIRTYFPIGFPWNLLGYTAYRQLDLIQFAEFTGVYGVSALIIFFNAVVYVVLFHAATRQVQAVSLGVATGLIAAAMIFGAYRIEGVRLEKPAGSIKIAMVQGDIPQSVKWDPKFLETSFAVYLAQSEAAANRGADLIVWPEAAAAFFFQPDDHYPADFATDAAYRARLLQFAADLGKPILFGSPALGVADNQIGEYNRAYLISASGRIEAWYDKIQLVPFGEYVPFRAVLGYFVNRVVNGLGDMIPGTVRTVFEVNRAKMGVLICYESVFPDLSRRQVDAGARILLNITNDAWYGESSAPYQLLAMSAMRSVENKVPVVRVANTGITALIEPSGEITARTALFTRGVEVEHVYWRTERTLYTIIGDVFAEGCFVLAAIAMLIAWLSPRAPTQPQEAIVDQISINGRGAERRMS